MQQSEDGFGFLRVSLEKRLQFPVILAVTSAEAADQPGLVAGGLAQSFAASGRRTLLVSAQSEAGVPDTNAKPGRGTLTKTGLRSLVAEHGGQSSAIAEALRGIRGSYDVVVIGTDPIVGSSAAFELASLSDGVLVAVRLGRKPCEADTRARALLESSGADVLGIVPTNARGRKVPTFRKTVPAVETDVRQLRMQTAELGR